MQLRKYQAVGNDFLLLLDLDEQQPIDEARARALCDRRRGVGADGLIRLTPGTDGADITFELRNSDGSPAETSAVIDRRIQRSAIHGSSASAAARVAPCRRPRAAPVRHPARRRTCSKASA